MNIGIIVFSQSGNTYSVAQKLGEKFIQAGHSTNIERIEIVGELDPTGANFQLTTKPQVAPYDAIVFSAPVMAFALSPAMKKYLAQIGSLKNKKVAFLVTKQLPFYWTGGRQAVNKMKKICESKDGTVCGSGIVIWSSARRDQMVTQVVDRLSKSF